MQPCVVVDGCHTSAFCLICLHAPPPNAPPPSQSFVVQSKDDHLLLEDLFKRNIPEIAPYLSILNTPTDSSSLASRPNIDQVPLISQKPLLLATSRTLFWIKFYFTRVRIYFFLPISKI